MTPSRVAAVLGEHRAWLMTLPGVVGVGEGMCGDQPCILVLVGSRTAALEAAVPTELDGIRVELRDTGPIKAE